MSGSGTPNLVCYFFRFTFYCTCMSLNNDSVFLLMYSSTSHDAIGNIQVLKFSLGVRSSAR